MCVDTAPSSPDTVGVTWTARVHRGRVEVHVGKNEAMSSDPYALGALAVGGAVCDTRRYYAIAGLTLQVESDRPFTAKTFSAKFAHFAVDGPGDDTLVIRHHFGLPPIDTAALGPRVRGGPPWAIYHAPWGWAYVGIAPGADERIDRLTVFDEGHTLARIYNGVDQQAMFERGGLASLTLMPTDQVLLARVLADRQGCFLHSCGVVLDGHGLLFVGESGAGKSTAMNQFAGVAEPLCDDRNIVRRWPGGVRVHGTWSHGSVPVVSAGSAPLRAVFFLHKSAGPNQVTRVDDAAAVRGLLPRLIRPLATRDWWDKTLDLVEAVVREVPCYTLSFDLSGGIVAEVRRLLDREAGGKAQDAPSAPAGP